ncbi:hypothetical protein K2173_021097 [Erythroxylum novogranatense]|uniref:Myb/SANT-like DNA-binding domain-containing protein n=1 Tax=Erythroxylum novogranatense TaxID=1862640 RepID=A0AAV8TMH9_9ROSI|nr:hypothetical protein K2173_021097 [Erythroxylum novogranatense]
MPGELYGSMQLHDNQHPQLYQCASVGQRTIHDGLHSDVSITEELNPSAAEGESGSTWQRVRWTEEMVKLLITALSYIGDEGTSDCIGFGRRKSSLLQKIGKWKCVSRVMVERGYHASPQQCEDKFNDLNKRYKKLNELLGRGTCCKVVQKPELLYVMDIPEKAKGEARKILSSKHLFYEEMCSYHNRNRLFLPHDPDLYRSLQLILWGSLEFGKHSSWQRDHDIFLQAQDSAAEDHCEGSEASTKRLRENETEDVDAGSSLKHLDGSSKSDAQQKDHLDLYNVAPEASKTPELLERRMEFLALKLEERKLEIQAQRLKLEKQQLQTKTINWKQDREIQKMRLENERIKLENEHMALELKHKELTASYK